MKDKNKVPDAAEFGRLRSYLARQGVSQQWIKDNTNKGKTRKENAGMLKAAMRELA